MIEKCEKGENVQQSSFFELPPITSYIATAITKVLRPFGLLRRDRFLTALRKEEKKNEWPHLKDRRVDRVISHDAPESDEGGFAENKRGKQGCNESWSDL